MHRKAEEGVDAEASATDENTARRPTGRRAAEHGLSDWPSGLSDGPARRERRPAGCIARRRRESMLKHRRPTRTPRGARRGVAQQSMVCQTGPKTLALLLAAVVSGLVCVVAVIGLGAGPASASGESMFGFMRNQVSKTKSVVVPGVKVTVKGPNGFSRTSTSDKT